MRACQVTRQTRDGWRLDHCQERTNLALEKSNVGERSLGSQLAAARRKADRRLYEKESYQKARDAEPGFCVYSLRCGRFR